jgi:hypothetical protein
MIDNEQSEIDVNTESSSETVEQTEQSTDSSQESVSQEAAPVQQKAEEVPFHEHPRFKELISEKNQYKNELQALAKRLQDMESRAPQAQPPKDELMERLKGIDPQFAERFGKISEVDQLKQELNEFKQWKEQAAMQQTQQQIQSTKESFYTENKVPAERKDLYEALLERTVKADPSLQISDLPRVLKSVHENIGKMFNTVERTTAKNFVDSKKADASKPATLKKGAPAQAVNKESNMSRNDIREAIKAEALAEARANKNI